MRPADVRGLIKTMSNSSANATPAKPMASGLKSCRGATPRAVVRHSVARIKPIAIPSPMGAASATRWEILSSISWSDRARLSTTPPASAMACCSEIARSQASCPCNSIIAAWHSGPTLVRREAPWDSSERDETEISCEPIILACPRRMAPPIKAMGAARNHCSA